MPYELIKVNELHDGQVAEVVLGPPPGNVLTAALMAEAGLRSSALNIIININAIRDEAFCSQMQEQLDALLAGRPALKDQIYDLVVEKL